MNEIFADTHNSQSIEMVWKNRCEDLAIICESFSWNLSIEAAYQRIVDTVADLFAADYAAIHLLSPDSDQLIRIAKSRLPEAETLDELYAVNDRKLSVGRTMWMMSTHEPIIMDYLNPDARDSIPEAAVKAGYVWAIAFPLISDDGIQGMCSLTYKTPMNWNADRDTVYVSLVGRILGTFFDRLHATKKTVDLQVLGERKRLSMEISNGISQLASGIHTNTEVALMYLQQGNVADAIKVLKQVDSASVEMVKTLRDETSSLGLMISESDNIEERIKKCLSDYQANWDIATSYESKSIYGNVSMISLSVSQQLIRIIKEALSNSIKHANATEIRVLIEEDERYLSLTIEDNGKGFNPKEVTPEKIGLRIMRERASAAGGRLSVVSGNAGTTICVDIPITYVV